MIRQSSKHFIYLTKKQKTKNNKNKQIKKQNKKNTTSKYWFYFTFTEDIQEKTL